VQVELKKGETIMIDAVMQLPPSFLHEAFSDRSGVPLDCFELYYRGKRLEGEATLASWGVGKDSTVEVKMRGRGGGTRMALFETKAAAEMATTAAEKAAAEKVTMAEDVAKAVVEVPDAAGGGAAGSLSIEGAPGSSGLDESGNGGNVVGGAGGEEREGARGLSESSGTAGACSSAADSRATAAEGDGAAVAGSTGANSSEPEPKPESKPEPEPELDLEQGGGGKKVQATFAYLTLGLLPD
jgi:hypothetical protein